MSRRRRRILSGKLYEVSFRCDEGLPLVPTNYMKLITEGIMARAQHNHPVELVNHLFMGNHPHMFAIARDSQQFTLFYGYLQEHLSKATKRLKGMRNLSMFNTPAQASQVLDLKAAIQRLIYIFTNPTVAHLERTIERYPGLNTWQHLISADRDVNAVTSKECPWVREPMIRKLPRPSLSERQDLAFTRELRDKTRETHPLIYNPLGWIRCFVPDASPEFIEECVQEVVEGVRTVEKEQDEWRTREGRKVLGCNKLRAQSLRKPFTPKKRSPALPFIICSDNKERIAAIEAYKEFCRECDEAYHAWKIGDYTVEWPPGAFKPAMPPTVNIFWPD